MDCSLITIGVAALNWSYFCMIPMHVQAMTQTPHCRAFAIAILAAIATR